MWSNAKSSRPLGMGGARSRDPIPAPVNPTLVEVHEWVQPQHCHQHDLTLRHGQLLRWMDIAACLSAERHSKLPCVTVSVDDITFESTVSVGHVVILRARVNRAFTSSMEVAIIVHSEDPLSGKSVLICKAYSVFVAKPGDGSKAKLPPLVASTEEEKREFLLAAERRRMRVTYAKDLKKVVRGLHARKETEDDVSSSEVCKVSSTQVHTVKIVLPVHANHHGTTFGGQIMEWMTDVATISALRLSRSQLVLEGIESVHFRGPSYMGERISLLSSVNKVFSNKRFEVGVRVEGYAVGGERRHINSAFFTFHPLDATVSLPKLVIDTVEGGERAENAIARHYLWLDRRAIKYEERQVTLSLENAYEMILKNTSRVMINFSLSNQWELLYSSDGLELSKWETSESLILRVHDTLEGISAKDVFDAVTNYTVRTKWDFMCKHCRAFRCISPDDDLVHLAYNNPGTTSNDRPRDFVTLCSRRAPQQYSNDDQLYMVAFMSVVCSDLPPLNDYERSQLISSGYILEDHSPRDTNPAKTGCALTYLHQVGSSTLPFVGQDLIGVTGFIQKVYYSLKKFLYSTRDKQ